jgi:signal peptidase II
MRIDARVRNAGLWAVGIVAADQLTKLWAVSGRADGHGWVDPAGNAEFSLGVFGVPVLLAVVLMAAAIVGVVAYGYRRVERGVLAPWGLGLVVGGATANLVDRVVLGSVQDFIVAGPIVLNVADAAVVVGLVAMVVAHRRSGAAPATA